MNAKSRQRPRAVEQRRPSSPPPPCQRAQPARGSGAAPVSARAAARSTLAAGRGQVRRRPSTRRAVTLLAIAIGAVGVLGFIFALSQRATAPTVAGQAGQYTYAVGNPRPGSQAPAIRLASTAGGTFDLGALRGKTVLLYFQEGLTCQPCWDQLKDIDAHIRDFHALGVDAVVSVTTDPLEALTQKVADEHITSPVLADPQLTVSTAYSANQYGMMGTSRDGHSFILVGPDGRIQWRADYGGPPNYTMYVPIPDLLADLRAGMGATGATAARGDTDSAGKAG